MKSTWYNSWNPADAQLKIKKCLLSLLPHLRQVSDIHDTRGMGSGFGSDVGDARHENERGRLSDGELTSKTSHSTSSKMLMNTSSCTDCKLAVL